MAKKSRSSRSASATRDAIAVQAMLRLPAIPSPVIQLPIHIQDERQYAPLRPVAPLLPGGRPARLRESGRRRVISFAQPELLDICRKRKTRREVIFAKGKSGKGAKALFRKRRFYTGVSCK